MKFSRMALLGVGYIGASAAAAVRRSGIAHSIVGYDPDAASLKEAQTRGILDEAFQTPATAVAGADLVLLAAPVQCMDPLVAEIAPFVAQRTLIMDVGSVKRAFVEVTSKRIPQAWFVGCHPMAGAEFSGVSAADARIFQDRICYLCPPEGAPSEAIFAAEAFWHALGSQTQVIEPQLHDRLMAAQSHLPHVAAFALAAALGEELPFLESTGTLSTTSLRDTTRIAASSPPVWRDIFLANASDLLPLISRLGEKVQALETALSSRDEATLLALLTEARECRRRLVKE